MTDNSQAYKTYTLTETAACGGSSLNFVTYRYIDPCPTATIELPTIPTYAIQMTTGTGQAHQNAYPFTLKSVISSNEKKCGANTYELTSLLTQASFYNDSVDPVNRIDIDVIPHGLDGQYYLVLNVGLKDYPIVKKA